MRAAPLVALSLRMDDPDAARLVATSEPQEFILDAAGDADVDGGTDCDGSVDGGGVADRSTSAILSVDGGPALDAARRALAA